MLLYGNESQKKQESRINAVKIRALRKICGVTFVDHGRNSEVREKEIGLERVSV